MSSPAAKPKGWQLILAAFDAAPKRTLTNVELGQVPGVQAFHQRISDLKRQGYVFTDGVCLRSGHYAYRLVGFHAGEDGSTLPVGRPDGLPYLGDAAFVADAVREAVEDLKANPPAERGAQPAPVLTAGTAQHRLAETVRERNALRERNAELEAENERLRELPTSSSAAADVIAAHHREVERLREAKKQADEMHAALLQRLRNALDEAGVEHAQGLNGIDVADLAVERLKAKPQRAARAPRAERGPTGPRLMRMVLEEADRPMHSKVIAERVLAHGGDQLYKGKTPAATMAAQLATSNKDGGEFVKVAPGCFGLREWPADKLDAEPVRA